MYYTASLTATVSDLKGIKIGLVDTCLAEVYYFQDGLHEVLAREICENRGYDWECGGEFISAVDYLLEKQEFIKLSNYGEGNVFRCFTVAGESKRKSKSICEWLECLTSMLSLRVDEY